MRRESQQRIAVETRSVLGRQRLVQRACDTKIQDFDLVVIREKDITGLEVRVHHAVIVHVGQRLTATLNDMPRLVPGQALTMFAQELVQRFSAHVFHDHEDDVAIAIEVVDTDDIRVVELAGVVDFAAQ